MHSATTPPRVSTVKRQGVLSKCISSVNNKTDITSHILLLELKAGCISLVCAVSCAYISTKTTYRFLIGGYFYAIWLYFQLYALYLSG